MKMSQKNVNFLLVLMLVLSLSVTAFADDNADTYTITINNSADGHFYEAYQIFTGDLYILKDDEGNITKKTLSNVKWGDNAIKTGAVSDEELNQITQENAIALVLSFVDFSKPAFATASTMTNNTYVIRNLNPGYYLVRDKKDTLDSTYDAHTAFILEVVESSEVSPKSAKPTVDKQVWDEADDAEASNTDGWGETADHAINESFKFKLVATLHANDNFEYYDSYKIIFKDSMSDGITFESIDSVTVGSIQLNPTQYTCTATTGQNGGNWDLTIDDLNQIEGVTLKNGTTVEVIYFAHLNEQAKIENDVENKNTVYLQYSNNPNADGDNDLGESTKDHVWVFTYKVDNKKTDENSNALGGAGFRLYSDENCTTEYLLIFDQALNAYRPVKAEETSQEMVSAVATGIFNIIGLDAGTYYLKETAVPPGYNECEILEVIISATHTENPDGETASTTLDMAQSKTSNTIINQSGIALPETGGTGTTLMYFVGGILVLAAVVLLVTKKRMANAE